MEESSHKKEALNLSDVIAVIVKRRWLVLWVSLVGILIDLVVCSLLFVFVDLEKKEQSQVTTQIEISVMSDTIDQLMGGSVARIFVAQLNDPTNVTRAYRKWFAPRSETKLTDLEFSLRVVEFLKERQALKVADDGTEIRVTLILDNLQRKVVRQYLSEVIATASQQTTEKLIPSIKRVIGSVSEVVENFKDSRADVGLAELAYQASYIEQLLNDKDFPVLWKGEIYETALANPSSIFSRIQQFLVFAFLSVSVAILIALATFSARPTIAKLRDLRLVEKEGESGQNRDA